MWYMCGMCFHAPCVAPTRVAAPYRTALLFAPLPPRCSVEISIPRPLLCAIRCISYVLVPSHPTHAHKQLCACAWFEAVSGVPVSSCAKARETLRASEFELHLHLCIFRRVHACESWREGGREKERGERQRRNRETERGGREGGRR